MQVSYSKGVANHAAPESCVGIRKDTSEALTGARAGQVLSRESKNNFGEPTVSYDWKATWDCSLSQEWFRPAWSETLCTYGNCSHGSREIPSLTLGNGSKVRAVNPKGVRQRCTKVGSRTG